MLLHFLLGNVKTTHAPYIKSLLTIYIKCNSYFIAAHHATRDADSRSKIQDSGMNAIRIILES